GAIEQIQRLRRTAVASACRVSASTAPGPSAQSASSTITTAGGGGGGGGASVCMQRRNWLVARSAASIHGAPHFTCVCDAASTHRASSVGFAGACIGAFTKAPG